MSKQTKQRSRVQKLVAQTNWQKGRLRNLANQVEHELVLWESSEGVSMASTTRSYLSLAHEFISKAQSYMIVEVETIKPVLAILDKRDKLTSSESK